VKTVSWRVKHVNNNEHLEIHKLGNCNASLPSQTVNLQFYISHNTYIDLLYL